MGYIKNNLQAGEEIVYRAKVHWFIFVRPVIIIILGSMLTSPYLNFLCLVGLLLMLSGLISLVRRIFVKIGTDCILTNKRVILKTGFFRRDALELSLGGCGAMKFSQSFLGRIFGFGSVVVINGSAANRFNYIAKPMRFRNVINSRIL